MVVKILEPSEETWITAGGGVTGTLANGSGSLGEAVETGAGVGRTAGGALESGVVAGRALDGACNQEMEAKMIMAKQEIKINLEVQPSTGAAGHLLHCHHSIRPVFIHLSVVWPQNRTGPDCNE
ncbi:hypothetical protein ATANTOWER_007611 [Ataeniobius toweri]|uniref:Uncharacterized protein n=1 Tax=Ataeniobius toweri TaxID=208326 RepID=A0ABU7C9G4_9TELE|nr:hypothetical protein [Ataeniobius toweri]